jgi:transcriptional regulator with XRE-family HTH domain
MIPDMSKSSEKSTAIPGAGSRPRPSAFSRALGARLRELREERGLSQRELGSRLGILQSKLSKYESGTHQPSLRTLVRMANLFAVSTDYLLTGAGTPAPPLRDERLLDRFRRLGAGGEELRSIVLSILDAMVELGTYFEQHNARAMAHAAVPPPGGAGAPGATDAAGPPDAADAAGPSSPRGRGAAWAGRRGKGAAAAARPRSPRRAARPADSAAATAATAATPPSGKSQQR